jgi:hypothetical protein
MVPPRDADWVARLADSTDPSWVRYSAWRTAPPWDWRWVASMGDLTGPYWVILTESSSAPHWVVRSELWTVACSATHLVRSMDPWWDLDWAGALDWYWETC